MRRIRIVVRGKVHGVGFRYYTDEQAQRLSLTGFVCNQSDGSVLIEAQGTEEALQRLIEWTKRGPASARVDSVDTSDVKIIVGESTFIHRPTTVISTNGRNR